MKRKHDTNSALCWCGPELQARCRICGGRGREDGSEVDLPCWRCHGEGWVEGHPEETGLVVIHQDVDDADLEQPAVACRGLLIVGFAFALLVILAAVAVMYGRVVPGYRAEHVQSRDRRRDVVPAPPRPPGQGGRSPKPGRRGYP